MPSVMVLLLGHRLYVHSVHQCTNILLLPSKHTLVTQARVWAGACHGGNGWHTSAVSVISRCDLLVDSWTYHLRTKLTADAC